MSYLSLRPGSQHNIRGQMKKDPGPSCDLSCESFWFVVHNKVNGPLWHAGIFFLSHFSTVKKFGRLDNPKHFLFFCPLKSSEHHHHHLSHFTSECCKFKQPGRITSFTTEWHRTKINIKISLLQMILYPVALFQQKIVITNKILHLSPKHFLCISWFFFIFTL